MLENILSYMLASHPNCLLSNPPFEPQETFTGDAESRGPSAHQIRNP